jgi:hypothetical protein
MNWITDMNKCVGPTAAQSEAARELRRAYEDGRITMLAPHGQHIALTCENHPEKRWSTKNIAPIGCRSIFYNLHSVAGMGPECDCPLCHLIVAEHG